MILKALRRSRRGGGLGGVVAALRVAGLAWCLISAPPTQAATTDGVRSYSAVVMAPAGDRMASIESAPNARSAVVLRDVATGRRLRVLDPCAACEYGSPAFAPDGDLGFVARQGRTSRILLATASGVTVLATVSGGLSHLRFSPDGTRLALLATIDATRQAGATSAGVRQVGELGGDGDRQRIAIVDLATSAMRLVSPASMYVYEFDWVPDGRSLVGTMAAGDGDANWWSAVLDEVDAQTGRLRLIAAPPTQINAPRVSPDGRSVAFIGGLMSDFGAVGGDVFVVPMKGGAAINVTAGAHATVTSLAWPTSGMLVVRQRLEIAEIARLSSSGAVRPLWRKAATLGAEGGALATSADGRVVAAQVETFSEPPAVFTGRPERLRRVTHDNDNVSPSVVARPLTWRSGPWNVQGWLLAPAAHGSQSTRRPLVTMLHGGPAGAWTPRYVRRASTAGALIDAGYALFLPNPRGSFGQGEAFTTANRRDLGGGDLDDVLAGIDVVRHLPTIDGGRLGLFGGSYGGFLSMMANTRTDRFKAIVAASGISNWISYYGTNGIERWMIPFMGASMYADTELYGRLSPIMRIVRARTPTLHYGGERDVEVPSTQSMEYWRALRTLGVPTSLIIYPDEGHAIVQAEHVIDARRRTVGWFGSHLR